MPSMATYFHPPILESIVHTADASPQDENRGKSNPKIWAAASQMLSKAPSIVGPSRCQMLADPPNPLVFTVFSIITMGSGGFGMESDAESRRAETGRDRPWPRPRISKSSPGTGGLGSEPPDEPVAGPDSTWSFERQAPAACSGTKGILYTITSRGVRTLHGVSAGHDTAFRHPEWFAYLRTNLRFRRRSVHSQLVWAPGAPYGLAWYADAKCESAHRVNSDPEPVAYPGLGDHVPRMGRVPLDFFPDLIDESS